MISILDRQAIAPKTPVEKMQASFPDAYEKRNGWWTHPDHPRFDFRERDDGSIIIHAWTGRTIENILSMGNPPLKKADLFPKNGTYIPGKYRKHDKLDLFDLSQYLLIDWQDLYQLGYSDGYVYTFKDGSRATCVKLGGYCNPDGTEYAKNKVRVSLTEEPRFLWDTRTPGDPIPCGLHKLDMAREQGFLITGEGESDWATSMFHGFPFLGISGADAWKFLDVSLLLDIPRIYILEEPDQAKKNKETGQGFYTNMRAHLREHGYTGEIFSLRFKQVTGCKDPSELHKTIYGACKLQEETVHRAEVKAKFAEAMQEALAHALPEGNASLVLQEEKQQAPVPPLPQTEDQRIQWLAELWAVPASILSPSQKMTFMVIMHYSGWAFKQDDAERWFTIETSYLAEHAGMDEKTFLRNLKYLTENLGLFRKNHIKHRLTPEESGLKPKYRTELRIIPSDDVWLTYPSTWRVTEGNAERKHGGVQTPRPTCNVCGSADIDEYKAYRCNACQHTQFVEVKVSPLGFESESVDDDESKLEHVESTADVLPLAEDAVEKTEITDDRIPNLGILYTTNYKDTQLGYPMPSEHGCEPDSQDDDEKEITVSASIEVTNLSGVTAIFPLEQADEAIAYVETLNQPPLFSPQMPSTNGAQPTPEATYDGPFPPPDKYCIKCEQRAWRWSSELNKYECATCLDTLPYH